jgi:hypothetical protein
MRNDATSEIFSRDSTLRIEGSLRLKGQGSVVVTTTTERGAGEICTTLTIRGGKVRVGKEWGTYVLSYWPEFASPEERANHGAGVRVLAKALETLK